MTTNLTTAPAADLASVDALRAAHWQQAAYAFLDAKEARTGSANTRRNYDTALNAWFDFLADRGRQPWQAGGVDVNAFRAALEAEGAAPATVANRLAVVSSFYRFCKDRYTLQDDQDREVTLINHNPIDRAERPRVEAFAHSQKIHVADLPALLRTPDRETLQGRRDYSILLAYILTGRRLVELAALEWGDLYHTGGKVFYTYKPKGKEPKQRQLPPPAWQAIAEYITASKRQMSETAPLWIAHSDAGENLPNVQPADGERPLSVAMIRRLVNRYTRLALGRPVSPHALRHAAAALRKDVGDDVYTIQQLLDHSSLNTTAGYLAKIDSGLDPSWQAAANLLGVEY